MSISYDDGYVDGFRDGERNMAGDIAKLRAALEAVLPYAENEAEALHELKDSEEAEAEAERATAACVRAQALLTATRDNPEGANGACAATPTVRSAGR